MVQDMGNSVLIALSDSLTATANLLPSLLAAIVIFIVGVVVAAILRNVLLRVLDAANFESALSPTGIPQALKKAEQNHSARNRSQVRSVQKYWKLCKNPVRYNALRECSKFPLRDYSDESPREFQCSYRNLQFE